MIYEITPLQSKTIVNQPAGVQMGEIIYQTKLADPPKSKEIFKKYELE